MGREVGGGFKGEGTYVYLWLILDDVWQKPSQYCKVIILQLKIIKLEKYVEKKKKKKTRKSSNRKWSLVANFSKAIKEARLMGRKKKCF